MKLKEVLNSLWKTKPACMVCGIAGTTAAVGAGVALASSRFPGNRAEFWMVLGATSLNFVAGVGTALIMFRRIRWRRDPKNSQRGNVYAEFFAAEKANQSALALIISFALLFILMLLFNKAGYTKTPISPGWLLVLLAPAVLSCLNSIIVLLRVYKGDFGYNALEGMEIIKFITKRGPPSDGGPPPRIFRDQRAIKEQKSGTAAVGTASV
jgi:uncharacterized membrane protein HdeD (DUF308 family)